MEEEISQVWLGHYEGRKYRLLLGPQVFRPEELIEHQDLLTGHIVTIWEPIPPAKAYFVMHMAMLDLRRELITTKHHVSVLIEGVGQQCAYMPNPYPGQEIRCQEFAPLGRAYCLSHSTLNEKWFDRLLQRFGSGGSGNAEEEAQEPNGAGKKAST